RSRHPLMPYIAIGPNAHELIAAQRLDWPLGPLEALAKLKGDVLLLGVNHTSNIVASTRIVVTRHLCYD
ncbi:MAG: AAC(3) family N-acetyltransferase, partial [Ktedonobacteraceae bacterium]|nr:AAC(3) family N-acetyltransferase [Ktedonobacteraceae bacterium]